MTTKYSKVFQAVAVMVHESLNGAFWIIFVFKLEKFAEKLTQISAACKSKHDSAPIYCTSLSCHPVYGQSSSLQPRFGV